MLGAEIDFIILEFVDDSNVTCLVRVPARFNNFPHFKDKVLIKVINFLQDFGCATLKQLQISYKRKYII